MQDHDMTRCLVTGAPGFVGGHLVDALLERGHHVACLVRSTSDTRRLEALRARGLPVELVRGDVLEPGSLTPALRDVDYVYHVAGLTKSLDPARYFRVNADGTASLLEACLGAERLRRVLVLSSLSALGPARPGRPLGEFDPPRPITPYGASKLAAERVVARYRDRLPITVVRPPAVYGPRDRDTLTVFKLVNLGIRPVPIPRQEVSLVDARDLARGVIAAAETEAGVGQTYHIANRSPIGYADLARQIALALGRRCLPVPIHPAVYLLGGAVGQLANRLSGKARIIDVNKAREGMFLSWTCSAERARADLGFECGIPLEQGLRDAVAFYREAGWL
jgi:nucleoside-diphosphate-sugar epimerase